MVKLILPDYDREEELTFNVHTRYGNWLVGYASGPGVTGVEYMELHVKDIGGELAEEWE